MKDDHEMVYQYCNTTAEGVQYAQVIGSWYCEEADRIYIFFYASTLEDPTQQDLLREFQKYLHSFVCH